MIKLTKEILAPLVAEYGPAFYLLDSERFVRNFNELKANMAGYYPDFNIAYSYKTNYLPKLCRLINEQGGLAEVVSAMELELALKVGVKPENIIWNGPYKKQADIENFLLAGGTVNLDAEYEFALLQKIAAAHPQSKLNIGIRCNYSLDDGAISRFGIDTESPLFAQILHYIEATPNLHLAGLQCHFAPRGLPCWEAKVRGMLQLLDKLRLVPERLDLGGGLFGKMAPSLKEQFGTPIPTFAQYAKTIAGPLADYFVGRDKKPLLLLEPGSALVGDCLQLVTQVINIKEIRGQAIATAAGSMYNINPTLNGKNPPLEIVAMGGCQKAYDKLDFGGYTCIESDYIYRNFKGNLAVGDLAVFGNGGSYSIVLKPPFILPNFPILEINPAGGAEVVKRGEVFDDLFHTFAF